MANKISKLKNILLCASASFVAHAMTPVVFAAKGVPVVPDPDIGAGSGGGGINKSPSVKEIVKLIGALLPVFRGAGIVLLAWSAFSLVMAIKDENVESKVHATSQLAVAVILVTFTTLLSGLARLVGVYF